MSLTQISENGHVTGQPVGEASPYFDSAKTLWFLHPGYAPCPEYDVEVGSYVFSYRPEYATYFRLESIKGRTLSSIAADLSIPVSIIKHWSKKIKDFGVSLELARQHSLSHWESLGLSGLYTKGFNTNGWLKTMEVLFPEEWKDPDPVKVEDPFDLDDGKLSNTLVFQGVSGAEGTSA